MALNIQSLTLMLLTILLTFFCFELSMAVSPNDPQVQDIARYALVEGRKFQFQKVMDLKYHEGPEGRSYYLTIEIMDRQRILHYTARVLVKKNAVRELKMFKLIPDDLSAGIGPNKDKHLNDPFVVDVAKWAVEHGALLHFERVSHVSVRPGMGHAQEYILEIVARDYKGEVHKYAAEVAAHGNLKHLVSFAQRN